MFENIVIPNPCAEKPSFIRPRKGVIIGLGQVGLACAYSMIIQNCFDELILQDIAIDKLEGEVMDLSHGMPFLAPTDLKSGTVADVGQNADIIIITAGVAQKDGESRLSLVERNIAVYKHILEDVVKYCPNAIILVVSNPVDILTYVTLKITGFPSSRVIGSGTVLDSARFRALLAKEMGIDARSVHAYIIGEHGDSEVAVWSTANIGGVKIVPDGWSNLDKEEENKLSEIYFNVKNAAYEIIRKKGYTSYAIGLATTDIVKAILYSQERILTVSGLMTGLYGIEDICLSIPRVVNEKGILKTVNLTLDKEEERLLQDSAKVLHGIFEQIKF
ncbi:MAG: L-lactate dehydrogenase [Cyanobacteria bacterium]|uniref:L-lactate dehydrogenase n=1 Tax=Geminocystis sp. TaxID=2664100 RepID=UPI001D251690|nr:L-lactate dehydrogenase [Cyanobacteria bacterium CG_2015-16_32_12]NCO77754.1 L-lactate dehydrogenase [Cyanobacteria bacterium CG_2015-22_32_23]NCQ04428.1 L-lactate dehydrogenase [Cyanobacteria bacterium CG_2015-09_32_10]NCQ42109.1 L-lactate dehydrogenase [Cyanobacteria bacterium CG_2015-04_32_10]NCS83568.1 L-lactate dehydrogenase [Cyanobacteria bacterium CG_2015-02_32_10]